MAVPWNLLGDHEKLLLPIPFLFLINIKNKLWDLSILFLMLTSRQVRNAPKDLDQSQQGQSNPSIEARKRKEKLIINYFKNKEGVFRRSLSNIWESTASIYFGVGCWYVCVCCIIYLNNSRYLNWVKCWYVSFYNASQ